MPKEGNYGPRAKSNQKKLNVLKLAGKESTVAGEKSRVQRENAKTRAAKTATAERMSKAGLRSGGGGSKLFRDALLNPGGLSKKKVY